MDIFEIIATVLGLIFYLWLNSRKPLDVPSPTEEPVPQPTSERKTKNKSKATNKRKYVNPENPREQEEIEEILQKYKAKPSPPLEQELPVQASSYETLFDEQNRAPVSFISKSDLLDTRPYMKMASSERMNRLLKMIQDKKTLQDVFILKEIFDRKWE
ncbi:MAG: hypothetical protein NZM38_06230 [Cytophagales bacterium]|nr:hypothetical protein [Cytophagales bacterium]MDW8384352.1 hypothetical protein [Flammeovirgaceae bacterium]